MQELIDELVSLLREQDIKVVLAESCTAGVAAAALGEVPGISQYFCGSAVAYREQTKEAWLAVAGKDLQQYSAVSEPVAAQMAKGVLAATPEADFAASITGHLGPDAPRGFDGKVFLGTAWREQDEVRLFCVKLITLRQQDRLPRRTEAAGCLLAELIDCIRALR